MRKRIRWTAAVLAAVMLILPGPAGAEVLGFGFVNNTDVAVRREPGGKSVGRLPEDTCVWILDSRTDKKGTLWYRINAGLNQNYANWDYSGWMMAQFIDAGEDVWHDVVSVSAMHQGMIAVRSDGTAEVAGRPKVSKDGNKWISTRGRAEALLPIVQATAYWGNDYAFMTEDGRVHGVETDDSTYIDDCLRIMTGLDFVFGIGQDNRLKSVLRGVHQNLRWIWPESEPAAAETARVVQMASMDGRVLMRTEDGRILAAGWGQDSFPEPEPDWSRWTGIASIAAGNIYIIPDESNRAAAVGVREDGTLAVWPSALEELIGGWTDMAEVQLSLHGAIGLKRDGTAVSVGWSGYPAIDVARWTDVTAVANGEDYGVGLKEDGTLVFAGEHVFMNEGHNKK